MKNHANETYFEKIVKDILIDKEIGQYSRNEIGYDEKLSNFIDSLDSFELCYALEERFGVEIPDSQILDDISIASIEEVVKSLIGDGKKVSDRQLLFRDIMAFDNYSVSKSPKARIKTPWVKTSSPESCEEYRRTLEQEFGIAISKARFDSKITFGGLTRLIQKELGFEM